MNKYKYKIYNLNKIFVKKFFKLIALNDSNYYESRSFGEILAINIVQHYFVCWLACYCLSKCSINCPEKISSNSNILRNRQTVPQIRKPQHKNERERDGLTNRQMYRRRFCRRLAQLGNLPHHYTICHPYFLN